MIGVPELGLYEEVLPLDDPLLEELLQRLPNDVLVVVVVGAVDEPIAGPHGGDDCLLGLGGRRLPGAETQPRHPRTIVQLNILVHLSEAYKKHQIEYKAKVVIAAWGTELLQCLAALEICRGIF